MPSGAFALAEMEQLERVQARARLGHGQVVTIIDSRAWAGRASFMSICGRRAHHPGACSRRHRFPTQGRELR
jgi:hypothetical protein